MSGPVSNAKKITIIRGGPWVHSRQQKPFERARTHQAQVHLIDTYGKLQPEKTKQTQRPLVLGHHSRHKQCVALFVFCCVIVGNQQWRPLLTKASSLDHLLSFVSPGLIARVD